MRLPFSSSPILFLYLSSCSSLRSLSSRSSTCGFRWTEMHGFEKLWEERENNTIFFIDHDEKRIFSRYVPCGTFRTIMWYVFRYKIKNIHFSIYLSLKKYFSSKTKKLKIQKNGTLAARGNTYKTHEVSSSGPCILSHSWDKNAA